MALKEWACTTITSSLGRRGTTIESGIGAEAVREGKRRGGGLAAAESLMVAMMMVVHDLLL